MINQQIKVFLFPKEHGGWAILVEALLVGLAFHHSFLSVGMGVMSTLVFLVINPLSFWLKDTLGGKRYPRTEITERISVIYLIGITLLFLICFLSSSTKFWIPLIPAFFLIVIQIFCIVRHQEKEYWVQVLSGMSGGAITASILIAGGYDLSFALLMWLLLAFRSLMSIVFIREKARQIKGERFSLRRILIVHGLVLFVLMGMSLRGGIPFIVVLAYGVGAARSLIMMKDLFVKSLKNIGLQEAFVGLLNSAVLIFGFWK